MSFRKLQKTIGTVFRNSETNLVLSGIPIGQVLIPKEFSRFALKPRCWRIWQSGSFNRGQFISLSDFTPALTSKAWNWNTPSSIPGVNRDSGDTRETITGPSQARRSRWLRSSAPSSRQFKEKMQSGRRYAPCGKLSSPTLPINDTQCSGKRWNLCSDLKQINIASVAGYGSASHISLPKTLGPEGLAR